MTSLRFFFLLRKRVILSMMFLGALAGICGSGIMMTTHQSLTDSDRISWLWVFSCLTFGYLFINLLFQTLLSKLILDSTLKLRVNLAQQLLAKPLRMREELGASRIQVILSHDVELIGDVIGDFPTDCMNFFIVIGVCSYLCWISPQLFLACILFLIFGYMITGLSRKEVARRTKLRRELWASITKQILHLIYGSKELSLNQLRKNDFFNHAFKPELTKHRDNELITMFIIQGSSRVIEVFGFLGLGFMIFFMPEVLNVETGQITGLSFVLIFAFPPIYSLLRAYRRFMEVQVTLGQLDQLGLKLNLNIDEVEMSENHEQRKVHELTLREITYKYDQETEIQFKQTMTFKSGQITVLTGSNGCGKTTLLKIITGLYEANSGSLTWNGKRLFHDASSKEYKNNIAAFFSDYHLFKELHGISEETVEKEGDNLLNLMGLDKKVYFEDHQFSNIDLSTAQKKRLALITLLMEEKPILILDEWEANQTKSIKDFFYWDLLQSLKDRGAMIILATNEAEDTSFADQHIHLSS